MKRRTVLQAGLAGAATLALPRASRAQAPKKLSYLTWNISDQEKLFNEEFAEFRKKSQEHPIEAVGANLRGMMSWLQTDAKKPGAEAKPQAQVVNA